MRFIQKVKKYPLLIIIAYIFAVGCDFTSNSEKLSTVGGTHTDGEYHHLEGELGNRKFSLNLSIMGRDVFGTMYFQEDEELRDVFGSFTQMDSLVLQESTISDFNPTNTKTFNEFNGTFLNREYKGSYTENAISKPFKCSVVSKKQIPFQFIKRTDTLFDSRSKQPVLYHEIEIPLVQTSKFSFLNTHLAYLAGIHDFKGNNSQLLKEIGKVDLNAFDSIEIEQMKKHPYTLGGYFDVSYNNNDLIIFSFCGLKFYGKMHETFEVRYCSINTKTKKEIILQDVLSPDEIKKLPTVLEKKFREKYKLKNEDKLSKVLFFDENKFMNNNYYITTKGIGFQYEPHELAGFSKGLITLYVPFSEIRNK